MTSTEQAIVHLRCRRCGWLSGEDAAAEVEAHLEREHPGQRIEVELVMVCPSCRVEHPVSAGQLAPTMTAFAKILFPTARAKRRPARRG